MATLLARDNLGNVVANADDKKNFPIDAIKPFDLQMIMIIIASAGREISR